MNIESAIKEVLAYADDDTHGYQLHSRELDYGVDCAGLMMIYASLVEGVPFTQYPNFHTWTEYGVLTSRGWKAIPFSESEKSRGDILLKVDPVGATGHTVLYLGDGTIVGAEGNLDGVPGDSSGNEICRRSYYDWNYQWIFRWEPEPENTVDEVRGGIYRLYNPNDSMHLFTESVEEARQLVERGWSYEGVPFTVSGGSVQQYRLYDPSHGAHLITSDANEAVTLACTGWVLEGFAFKTPKSGIRVYRLYNQYSSDHLYTCDTDEVDSCVAAGWTEEGLAFYAASDNG